MSAGYQDLCAAINTLVESTASILIGILLISVAFLLISETKALLIGEGADKESLREIRTLALANPAVDHVGYPLTMYFGPKNVLLTMNIQFRKGLEASAIEKSIDQIETSIRSAYPHIQYIYLEADTIKPRGRGEDMALPAAK